MSKRLPAVMKTERVSGVRSASLLAVICVLALGACSSKPKSADAKNADAKRVNSYGTASATVGDGSKGGGYHLPPYRETRLENGLTVLFVPDDKLPYITYSLLVRAGAVQDPAELGGVSAMVAELMDKGTKKRSAQQIAAELEQMGAEFDVSSSQEYTVMTGSALSAHGEALLKNVFEILTEPTFSNSEIERMRKQILASIQHRIDRPEALAEMAFASFLYGDHPYSKPLSGSLKSVAALKKKHLIQHYLKYFRPNNAILSIAGKYDAALEEKILKTFAAWPAREVPAPAFPPLPEIKGLQIEIVDKPGAVQSQIRLGHYGIKRQNSDFVTLRVANTVLGGAFASRLNDRIRKELGLTYSISSNFDARLDRGPFEISTFTKNASVGQTLAETLKVYGTFRAQGVQAGEVDMAKGYLKGIFPTAIETAEKLAMNLSLLRFYGVPDSYLTTYLNEIDRVSVADLNGVIQKYFDDRNLKVVVYSTAADVVPQVEEVVKASGGTVSVKKATELQ